MPLIEDYIRDNVTPGFVIVPNELHDNIHKALDAEIARWPAAEKDREFLFKQILTFVYYYGYLPEFSLEPRANTTGGTL
jgi:hypothetical protein